MHNSFYNLKENPFSVTADPAFFFKSSRHNEAIAHLLYGITERKGIIVVTGEIGTGKTTLCRTLLNILDNRVKTALILNPNFSETQLLQLVLRDLGLEAKQKNKFELIEVLNQFLLKQSGLGNNVTIIIDESQNLKPGQLEHIRLLSNLETEKAKLLQIVLFGQPELIDKLRLTSLRQLNQRISVRYHMEPLNRDETDLYIKHRLQVAGADPRLQFTKNAVDVIFEQSAGTPRVINILCDRALLAGFVAETYTLDKNIMGGCIADCMGLTV